MEEINQNILTAFLKITFDYAEIYNIVYIILQNLQLKFLGTKVKPFLNKVLNVLTNP